MSTTGTGTGNGGDDTGDDTGDGTDGGKGAGGDDPGGSGTEREDDGRNGRDPRVGTIRTLRRLDPRFRAHINAQRHEGFNRLRALDRSMAAMASERRDLLTDLGELDQPLVDPALWPRGRRPAANTVDRALPDLPHDARYLWGRRLRAVCLRLLQRCGTLPLRQLHALLHLHGFGVAGDHPVKTLADALGHEVDTGHARRISRGHYALAPGHRPPPQRRHHELDTPLPDLTTPDGDL